MDKNKELYITKDNFFKLLGRLNADYTVYLPAKKGNVRYFRKFVEFANDFIIGEVRTFEPLKSFFTKARETVAEGFSASIPHYNDKPFAIVGVKACDLKGFKIQDFVFQNHDYEDPFYIKKRRENLIISSDCTMAIDVCYCLALDVTPYPVSDFDINLSELDTGFIVEIGSQKGEALIQKHSSFFAEAKKEVIDKKNNQRSKVTGEVEKNIQENKIPKQDRFQGIIHKNYNSDIWAEEAKTCVECGACTIICPTCHCFLLYDQKDEKKMARLRVWDSCMIKDYAKVAGGANPRPKLWMRLRNRFEKKFDFFPNVAGVYACTGCGRCISACPAKIDIRKILGKLVSGNR